MATDGRARFLVVGCYKAAVAFLSQIFRSMHAFPLRGDTSMSGVGERKAAFEDAILF